MACQSGRVRDFAYTLRKLEKCCHLYLARTADRGFGVFAARPFQAGEFVLVDLDGDYFEQVLSYRELLEWDVPIEHTLQVGPDAFKPPTGSLEDFTNHSCDPNTGIRLCPTGTIVLALRPIHLHDEITYDYSTYLNNPYEHMTCKCGSPICRGVVGNFDTLSSEQRSQYLELGVVGDFVLAQRQTTRDG